MPMSVFFTDRDCQDPAQFIHTFSYACIHSLAILSAMSSVQCSSDMMKCQEVDTPPKMELYTQSVRESVVIIDVPVFP